MLYYRQIFMQIKRLFLLLDMYNFKFIDQIHIFNQYGLFHSLWYCQQFYSLLLHEGRFLFLIGSNDILELISSHPSYIEICRKMHIFKPGKCTSYDRLYLRLQKIESVKFYHVFMIKKKHSPLSPFIKRDRYNYQTGIIISRITSFFFSENLLLLFDNFKEKYFQLI